MDKLTLYTFGDSILDCRHFNAARLDPGQLIVRNDDRLFPEFRGRDLAHRGEVVLDHRARSGSRIDGLAAQVRAVRANGPAVALVTIGGNDLLAGLITDRGRALSEFARTLGRVLGELAVRPVLLGNVYDPTFGDDRAAAQSFPGVVALARNNLRDMNHLLAEVAAKHGHLVDLHDHFLGGDPSWLTSIIEPSLRGASEVRRCFLPHLAL